MFSCPDVVVLMPVPVQPLTQTVPCTSCAGNACQRAWKQLCGEFLTPPTRHHHFHQLKCIINSRLDEAPAEDLENGIGASPAAVNPLAVNPAANNVDECKLEELSFIYFAVLPFAVVVAVGPLIWRASPPASGQDAVVHGLLLLTWSVAALALLTCLFLNSIWRALVRAPPLSGKLLSEDTEFLRCVLWLEYICLLARWLTKVFLVCATLACMWRSIDGICSVVFAALSSTVLVIVGWCVIMFMAATQTLWHDFFPGGPPSGG